MIRLSNSLFLSIVLHTFVFIILVISYNSVSLKKVQKETIKKESRVCVHLQTLEETKITTTSYTPPPKKIIQKEPKVKKIKSKKVLPKKKIQKKKKSLIKKKEIVQKIVKEKIRKKAIEKKIFIPHSNQPPSQKKTEAPKQEISHQVDYLTKNLLKIRELIQENLYYPRRARKRGIEGVVVIRFKLSSKAIVSDIEIVSSKKEVLSRAAIKTIESLSSKFPKPKEEITLKIPISYTLKR